MTTFSPESGGATLSVALTGSLEQTSTLLEALESPGSPLRVLARVERPQDGAAQLRDRSLAAVLHCVGHDVSSLTGDVVAIKQHTEAPIILLSAAGGPELVETALHAGVDDVLVLPQRAETIAFAVRKATQTAERASAEEGKGRGEVLTVFSPKGGTGKTVLATNLGAYLAAKTTKRVLLIDLDLQFGDAAIMLGLDPRRTMHELVQSPGELDPGKLSAYTTRHRSGLDVLAAPLLPEQAELVTEPKVVRLIEVAREAYDLVVIDTSPFFYGPMLALLAPTDQLLLLCGLDVPTLKNVRLSLRTLELLGFPSTRTNLILNRVTSEVGLTAEDVAEALGLPVAFEVPNDPVVAPAVNRGTVAALHETESEFARAVAAIAASVHPALATPPSTTVTLARTAPRLRRFVPRRVLEGRV